MTAAQTAPDALRSLPVAHGAASEVFTEGAISRRDIFPQDWRRIWPELAEQSTEKDAA
jgi:hypothetical protein